MQRFRILSPNLTETGLVGEPGLSFCCPLLLQSKVSTGRRKGRNRDCPHVGHQNVRVVGDAGCERVHKEKKVKI